ncbi:syntaxin-71-like [Apium graveolens]|uniref:syntaxin-71-like n=1 Tax=Apium graveolens TaxID=4045 RepID=UPI003D7B6FCB
MREMSMIDTLTKIERSAINTTSTMMMMMMMLSPFSTPTSIPTLPSLFKIWPFSPIFAKSANTMKKRASTVAINTETRREKARLLEQVLKLQRLALKEVKELSPQEFVARNDLALVLTYMINLILNGTPALTKQATRGWASSTTTGADIKFDSNKNQIIRVVFCCFSWRNFPFSWV